MVAAAIGAALAAPAQAAHFHCGDAVTTSTTLDQDLTCDGTALSIAADGITLDLGGHTVRSGTTAIEVLDHNDVTVRGGTVVTAPDGAGVRIRGARSQVTGITARGGVGIYFESSSDGLVAGNRISDASLGVFTYYTQRVVVRQNTFERIAGDPAFGFFQPAGVSTFQSHAVDITQNRVSASAAGARLIGSEMRVLDNTVEGGGLGVSVESGAVRSTVIARNRFNRLQTAIAIDRGDWTYGAPSGTRIAQNVISRSTEAGISLGRIEGTEVTGNSVTRGKVGIRLGDGAHRSRLAVNDVSHNAEDGIQVLPFTVENVLERNRAHHNGDDGIEVGLGPNTVTANVANHNGDFGIAVRESYYDVDGGGNRAKGNGNPLQCLNVECSP